MIQIDSSAELDTRVFPLETPSTLDGQADLVYTGQRALCWLHDLNAWAARAAAIEHFRVELLAGATVSPGP